MFHLADHLWNMDELSLGTQLCSPGNEITPFQASKCIICQKSKRCSVTSTANGLTKIIEAASIRKDIVYHRIMNAIRDMSWTKLLASWQKLKNLTRLSRKTMVMMRWNQFQNVQGKIFAKNFARLNEIFCKQVVSEMKNECSASVFIDVFLQDYHMQDFQPWDCACSCPPQRCAFMSYFSYSIDKVMLQVLQRRTSDSRYKFCVSSVTSFMSFHSFVPESCLCGPSFYLTAVFLLSFFFFAWFFLTLFWLGGG